MDKTSTTAPTAPTCTAYALNKRRTVGRSTVTVKDGVYLLYRSHKKLGYLHGVIGFLVEPINKPYSQEEVADLVAKGDWEAVAKAGKANLSADTETRVFTGQRALLALQGKGGNLPLRLRAAIMDAIRKEGGLIEE